jgi:predicted RNA-binding Zn-ribbon protein involved in translation (DUF1610 family)
MKQCVACGKVVSSKRKNHRYTCPKRKCRHATAPLPKKHQAWKKH